MAHVLLDTHAFMWAAATPDRLTDLARATIEDRSNSLHVSAASVWEMAIKVRSGQWPDAAMVVDRFESVVERLGAEIAGIGATHARRAGLMHWEHRDPFDRLIVAHAIEEQWSLVSRDRAFGEVPALAVIW